MWSGVGPQLMSLLSVDDIVRAVYSVLTSADEWDNTVWLYTSDHGVNMGQFRIPCVKRQVYESNTRIPSFIKAPGVAAGAVRYELVSHVDAVPTLLGLANIQLASAGVTEATFDGRDFSARLRAHSSHETALPAWKTTTILEYSSLETDASAKTCDDNHIKSTRNNTWIALRVVPANASASRLGGGGGGDGASADPTVGNWLYVEFTDVLNDWNFTCGPSNLTAVAAATGPPEQEPEAAACPAGVRYRKGQKITGNKLGKELSGLDLAGCCGACSANGGCLFFSFAAATSGTKPEPAKCWLHDGDSSGYNNVSKVTTGSVRARPGPAPPPAPPAPPPAPPSHPCSAWHAELYDMTLDPWQLRNLYYEPGTSEAARLAWHARLHEVRRCRGTGSGGTACP